MALKERLLVEYKDSQRLGTKIRKFVGRSGWNILMMCLGGTLTYMVVQQDFIDKYKENTKKNLASNALYIPFKGDFEVTGDNKDVNGDGTIESVLAFKNPKTGEIETKIIELWDNEIRIRPYEVVDGKIKYLDELCD